MKKQPLCLSLGTNLGDRQANIDRAVAELDKVFAGCRTAITPPVETKAIGFDGADFLNCLVVYQTARKPELILQICKEIERKMGRPSDLEFNSAGERVYHDRIIDIDILTYGSIHMDTPTLRIPHPQIETRPYIGELLLLL